MRDSGYSFVPAFVVTAVIFVTMMIIVTACNPSPRLKAIAADEKIRAEVCDLFPPILYSKRDTEKTKDMLAEFNTKREAYCEEGSI